MTESKKQSKMTLEKLATMSQKEFLAIRREMATKEDLKAFATREDLKTFKDEIIDTVRQDNLKVLQSNDKIVTRLDRLLKEDAAHTEWHKRIDKKLDDHEGRLKKLEHVRQA